MKVIRLMMSAVFRFHLHVGIRLALRIFVPVVSIFIALYYLLRPELFNSLMAQILDGGFLLSGITTTFFCLIIAGFASRRICLGLNGWIRHLHRSNPGIGHHSQLGSCGLETLPGIGCSLHCRVASCGIVLRTLRFAR